MRVLIAVSVSAFHSGAPHAVCRFI